MEKFFIPQLKRLAEKMEQSIREGLRGLAEFLKTPSKAENALPDAQRAGSYFAHLNSGKINSELLSQLTKE